MHDDGGVELAKFIALSSWLPFDLSRKLLSGKTPLKCEHSAQSENC